MKTIYFNKLDNWQNKVLIITAVILMLSSFLEIFEEISKDFSNIAFKISNLLIIIFFVKMIIFKNNVSWNKVGMNIKVNQFVGKNINFNKIETYQFEGEILTIFKSNGKKYNFDLNEIVKSDQEKLKRILEYNTVGNNGSSPISGSLRKN